MYFIIFTAFQTRCISLSDGKFLPEDIDPKLCTHIVYAFGKITNGQIATREWNDDQMIARIVALKEVEWKEKERKKEKKKERKKGRKEGGKRMARENCY